MPTAYESARLNLQLFEMRQEPVLREARAWFLAEFTPETLGELAGLVAGPRNASFRMVLGYWDMAASLVTGGAIDGDSFRRAHGEVFITFSKVYPFLAELRQASGEPDFCRNLEAVVLEDPNAQAIMTRRRAAALAAAKARAATGAAVRDAVTGTATAEITAAEERLHRAQLAGDVAELDALIADELLFTGPDGQLGTKAADLAQHASGAVRFRSHEPEDLRVRPIGDNVAVVALQTRLAVEIGGQLVRGTYRYTRVWAREGDGRWRVVGGHVSEVPALPER